MRGVVGMRGLAWFGALGLVACTVTNPAYQASDESANGESDGSTSDEPAEGSDTADTEDGASSGELVCELHPFAPLALRVTGSDLLPRCDMPGEPVRLDPGNNQYMGGNVIRHSKCDVPMCPCTSDSYWDIELGSDVQFAEGVPLPGCGAVQLWTAPGLDGECEWAGVVLFHEGTFIPDYIASRTLGVPPLGLELELLVEEECPDSGECRERQPGRYALGVLDEVIAAEEAPRNIEVQLGLGELYLFDNRMSSVNESCELELAWTAQRWLL